MPEACRAGTRQEQGKISTRAGPLAGKSRAKPRQGKRWTQIARLVFKVKETPNTCILLTTAEVINNHS